MADEKSQGKNGDRISHAEAARILRTNRSAIGGMLDRGELDHYFGPTGIRRILRDAVLAKARELRIPGYRDDEPKEDAR